MCFVMKWIYRCSIGLKQVIKYGDKVFKCNITLLQHDFSQNTQRQQEDHKTWLFLLHHKIIFYLSIKTLDYLLPKLVYLYVKQQIMKTSLCNHENHEKNPSTFLYVPYIIYRLA